MAENTRIEVHVPTRVLVMRGGTRYLGHTLSAMGFEHAIVLHEQVLPATILKNVETSLGPLIEIDAVTPVDRASPQALAAELHSRSVVIALGDGHVVDAAKIAAALVKRPLAAVLLPPGVDRTLTGKALLGRIDAAKPVTPSTPVLSLLDPELSEQLPRERVSLLIIEALTSSLESLVNPSGNFFAQLLAREALQGLARATRSNRAKDDAGDDLHFYAIYAALAKAHSGGLSPTALACALEALLKVDYYHSLAALLEAWLKRVPLASKAVEMVEQQLKEVEAIIAGLYLEAALEKLKPKVVDLVVEYAYTHHRYMIERDPAVRDKYSLRELLLDAAIGRSG